MEELMLIEHLKNKGFMGSMSEHEEMVEKAFKEGCEHGYKKAMKELEAYNERSGRIHFKDGFEDKIKKLKEKYK